MDRVSRRGGLRCRIEPPLPFADTFPALDPPLPGLFLLDFPDRLDTRLVLRLLSIVFRLTFSGSVHPAVLPVVSRSELVTSAISSDLPASIPSTWDVSRRVIDVPKSS